MNMNSTRIVAVFLIVIIVTPASLFLVPQRAHALLGIPIPKPVIVISDPSYTSLLKLVKSTITSIESATSAVANTALVVDKYVLEPLAFATSGNLIKKMIAGVLDFVGGTTNGTGRPQFVQNLQGHMRGVGDVQALSFLTEFSNNSNSPFASSIVSSLRTRYLQNSSLSGFFASNRSTLSQYSPNQNAFLAGDWSQGGVSAWLALTTQDQNNPYMLHARAQAELGQLVANATSARLADLNWGQGFLSWCGADSSISSASGVATTSGGVSASASGVATTSGGVSASASSTTKSSSGPRNAPGDACTNADGSPGIIKTPGSTIKDSLSKALGLNADKIVAFGNQVGPELGTIFSNIATVMQTVKFATTILGGSNQGLSSTGMIGSPARAALQNLQNKSGYLGTTQTSVNKNASSQFFSGKKLLSNIRLYEASWNTIASAANTTSTALTKTTTICNAAGNTSQGTAANNARLLTVVPVLSQASRVTTQIATARALIAKMKTEVNATSAKALSAYQADLQTLQTMPPTSTDVVNAQEQSQAFVGATIVSSSSMPPFVVSRGTIVDQMNLLLKNAITVEMSCSASGSSKGNPL